MKKNYFLLAATTMMFAACAQTDLVNEVVTEEAPQAIGFETFAEKATRAKSQTTELSTHHTNYYVWGYKNTDNSTLVFAGQEVAAANNEYKPVKYWDKAASTYYFYATAPSGFTFNEVKSGNVVTQNGAYFTLSNVEMKCTNFTDGTTQAQTALSKDGGDIDYMISTTTAHNNTTAENQFYDPVNFNFKHILSRLNVTVNDKDNNTSDITLNFIKVIGLTTKATTFTSNENVMDSRWVKDTSVKTDYVSTTSVNVPYGTTGTYVLEALVIPQTVKYEALGLDGTGDKTEPYVHVQYQMGTAPNVETYNAYYNLAALFGADGTTKTSVELSEACLNTLHFIFNPSGIVFSTTTTSWGPGNTNGAGTTIE